MAYRNKTYVSFDGDRDIRYYYLMKAWKDSEHMSFNFYDAHGLSQSRDSSLETTIKASLRQRMSNAKTFVILVGEGTRYLYKFVRWEIELAIRLDLPIVAVNINGSRRMDSNRCPPILREELAVHVPFKQTIVQYALDYWPNSHADHRRNGDMGPYYYKDSVYRKLGML